MIMLMVGVVAVDCKDVTKTYRGAAGPLTAVDGITLQIPRGSLFGFLGPNGAGKTSLMRMLHAAFPPTSGSIRVLGHDVVTDARALKSRLGVVPQENNLDPDFTVEKNLTTYARYFDIPREAAKAKTRELLVFVGLTEKAREPVERLSGGMKRRLVLARALLNDPELLILDEPTTGLDPQSRHLVWNLIRDLRRRGLTVLLTTHYLDEAERLCDDLVIVDGGKILVRGNPKQLIAAHAGADVVELAFDGEAKTHESGVRRVLPDGARVEFSLDRAYIYGRDGDATARAARATLPVQEALVRRATLEDVFLHLTGRGLRE